MYYQIVDAIDDVVVDASQNKSAIGIVAFNFYWRRILDGILPKQSTGLVLVFENPCGNQLFTYRIDGHTPIFLGFGDLHDPPAQSSTLADLTTNSGIAGAHTGLPMNQDFCPFRLAVYPSADMHDRYITRSPIYVAVGPYLYLWLHSFWPTICLFDESLMLRSNSWKPNEVLCA